MFQKFWARLWKSFELTLMGSRVHTMIVSAEKAFAIEHSELPRRSISGANKSRWIMLRRTCTGTSIQIHLFYGEERWHHGVTQKKENCERRQFQSHFCRWRRHARRSHSTKSQIELNCSLVEDFIFENNQQIKLVYVSFAPALFTWDYEAWMNTERGSNDSVIWEELWDEL